MTVGSLAYRNNTPAIRRGDVPAKYTRLLPYIPGDSVVEIGSAEGVLSLLLARKGMGDKSLVIGVERSSDRHQEALALELEWSHQFRFKAMPVFVNGDISDNLGLFDRVETLVAVRSIYYLGDDLDKVFAAAAKSVPNVVLCGNGNRAKRWREGIREETKADNYYASSEGMTDLLTRHGYRIVQTVSEGDEIVIGRIDG